MRLAPFGVALVTLAVGGGGCQPEPKIYVEYGEFYGPYLMIVEAIDPATGERTCNETWAESSREAQRVFEGRGFTDITVAQVIPPVRRHRFDETEAK
jgi:hypothetical protein